MEIKTIRVVRKGHPEKFVVINEDDMLEDDIIFSEENEKKEEQEKDFYLAALKEAGVTGYDKRNSLETLAKAFDELS